ncbi:MAG: HAD-IA family hydrolase [Planctomycetes bacterium]|nr:HAD-IA family hydrolase [Planctomycetota bacterium]
MLVRQWKLITLDFTGTLVQVRGGVGAAYARAAREHGLETNARALGEAFSRAFAAVEAESPNFGFPVVPAREWWRRVVFRTFSEAGYRTQHLQPIFDRLFETFAGADAWECYPETKEVLDTLKGRGVRLGVISNFDERLPGILEALSLLGYFDFVLASRTAGWEKPHRAIFEAALERAGVPPGAALHVGDSEGRDYNGARAAGMHALCLQRDAPRESGLPHVIGNLREILDG